LTTTSIILRRTLALATSSLLIYLLHPLPTPSPLLSLLITLPTLIFTYHLALCESTISLNGREINLKWLVPALNATVALAASAEKSWIRTNVLWDCVVIVWVCGWKAMSARQKNIMLWITVLGVGAVVFNGRDEGKLTG
jgi:hypothetical protein